MTDAVLLLSGQGSQYPSMARDLFRSDERFRAHLQHVDVCLRQVAGRSVLPGLLLAKPPFDDVTVTHLGIFATQYASAMMLIDRGVRPTAVLAISLGEFAAAVLTGAWSLEHAARVLSIQTRALAVHCDAGGMMAVLAPPEELEGELTALPGRPEVALRSRRHFVLAGNRDALDTATGWLAERGYGSARMPVTRGFHSRQIDPAREPFLAAAEGDGSVRLPQIPWFSCALAAERRDHPAPADLWQAIRAPIRFLETAAALGASGKHRCVDVGPGAALTTLMRDNDVPMIDCRPLSTAQGDVTRQLSRLLAPGR
ncbi:acyl transferase domain-containing protein [Actinoplanes tereljensis]|uniref:Polyketide biosynthesis acyltransferase PksD n=1 Tax=Paractinoplanes tereljensis TaxID=571912 RepID=A0A919TQ02_9ACTN|nr:acyltransferase domain-containing protein [Actinoplanes tereljensis]GIF17781.1 polyketide biosynthesis acyltransferase PksD [Actinoplanes tereljensis]